MPTNEAGHPRRSGAVIEQARAASFDVDVQREIHPLRWIPSMPDARWVERATLIVNPSDDRAFEDHARRLAVVSDGPQAMQTRLRRHYPHAVVRRRDLSGEPFEMWYVYRDGHWSPPGT